MIGRDIGPYRITEHLGTGGMGEVYKAEDTRLHRPVALKFLAADRIANEESRTRFVQEARAVAALDHPNVCTIYEIGEIDGRLFLAMAFYDGETLDKRLQRGPLPLDEALGIAARILDGLEAAHERQVLHRDVKPGNIFLGPRGEVKLLDFGLSKLLGQEKLTRDGVALGTPAYMSPEQIYGREVDARSDLWAVGVVLYEMVSGDLPFHSPDETGLLYSIAQGNPQPLGGLPTTELMLVGPVVKRAMVKNLEARYGSAAEMRADVERLQVRFGVGGHVSSHVTPAALPALEERPSIAVLPFEDLSPGSDQEYFCLGVADELVTALARIEGLRVASRTSASQFRSRASDVRAIGRRLGVSTVLEGSVRKAGDRVRISVQLIQVEDGLALWSGRFDRTLDDVFAIQEELAATLVETLKGKLRPQEQKALGRRATESPGAYNNYLKGRYFWNRRTSDGLRRGIEHFETALATDPRFASAYAGLADSYAILGVYGTAPPREVFPKARNAALHALAIDEGLAEAHTSLAAVRGLFDWDWAGAEEGFRRAIRLDPHYPTARQWLAMNALVPQRRFPEAEEQLRAAAELDPLSSVVATSLGLLELYRRRYDRAAELQRNTLELDPGFAVAHFFLGQSLLESGKASAAIREIAKGLELSPDSAEMLAGLAAAHARAGERVAANKLLQQLLGRAREGYVSAVLVAQVYAALDERERAFEWLHQAVEDRAVDLAWAGVRPGLDPLRQDARFGGMLRTLGLHEAESPPTTAG